MILYYTQETVIVHSSDILPQAAIGIYFNMLNTVSQCMFISLKTNDSSSFQMLIFHLHIFFKAVLIRVLLAFLIMLFFISLSFKNSLCIL